MQPRAPRLSSYVCLGFLILAGGCNSSGSGLLGDGPPAESDGRAGPEDTRPGTDTVGVETGTDTGGADKPQIPGDGGVDTSVPDACGITGACTPVDPCHLGKRTCGSAGEICEDTGNLQANGTQCGTDKVCSDGACVACTAGTDCALTGQPCKLGRTDCASGKSVCVEVGSAANGKMCETDKVCSDGNCVACADGASCVPTNACHEGTLSCAAGTPAGPRSAACPASVA